jgi:hypothetical protein
MIPLLGYIIIEWTVTEVAALAVSIATFASLSLTAAETAQRLRKAAANKEETSGSP